jgi:hypothetical protein
MILGGADGDVIYVNDAARAFVGGDDHSGHPPDVMTKWFHADDRTSARKLMQDVLDQGGPAGARLRTVPDPSRVIELTAIPVAPAAGPPVGVLVILVA